MIDTHTDTFQRNCDTFSDEKGEQFNQTLLLYDHRYHRKKLKEYGMGIFLVV
ncbi:hypothetical protein A3Q56_03023 [Intoshia linei]|uniref:Uncharacterized protein n=1 Tax=Intoshia linei TaxID=1819745 RepID=A0A177B4M3_9BILA|nr:hypothetical protein A3Q56_03023 [Intoshia linei]